LARPQTTTFLTNCSFCCCCCPPPPRIIVIVAWRSFEVKAFFPEDIYCVCSYVFLMRFLKRLKFLKIQRELSDDSNVTPFTNFNVKSDLLLTRRVSRTKVFFCCLSESCSKIASSLLRVYNPREKSQKILREKVTKNEGKTNRQKFRANESSFEPCLRPHKTRSNGINARGIHSSLIISRQSFFWLSPRALTLIYIYNFNFCNKNCG